MPRRWRSILTGEPLSAQRAYELGLVNRLVEPGQALEEATKLAEQICAAAPLAVRASRKVVLASAYEDDETLKKMTNEELRRDHGLAGHHRRPHRVHREAGPELAGQVTRYRRVETMILRAVIPARS